MAPGGTAQRLRKSSRDKVLFGVCSGLGAYFSVDPVLIRVIFAVLTIMGGMGLILYLALAIIMPREDADGVPAATVVRDNLSAMPQETVQAAREVGEGVQAAFRNPASEPPPATENGAPANRDTTRLLALILIAVGAVFLIGNLGLFRLRWDIIWPALLIAVGLALLARRGRTA